MDTSFLIFDQVGNTDVYLLKDWVLADPDRVVAWENLLLTIIGGAPVCNYDVDHINWIGKSIMNSVSLDIWDSIEKYLEIGANGPATYAAII